MNYEALGFWLLAGQALVGGGLGWITRRFGRMDRRMAAMERTRSELLEQVDRTLREELRRIETALKADLENHATRIARLEAAQITHEDIGRVYQRLETVSTTCSEMKGELTATGNQLSLVCDHLMRKGKEG